MSRLDRVKITKSKYILTYLHILTDLPAAKFNPYLKHNIKVTCNTLAQDCYIGSYTSDSEYNRAYKGEAFTHHEPIDLDKLREDICLGLNKY